ncbi:hypothetical protein ACSSS7_001169 [Eimeria intestinalis]
MSLSGRARLTPESPPAAPLFGKPQPSASSGVLRLLQPRVELLNLLMLPALFAAFLSLRLPLFVDVAEHRETDLRRRQQRQPAPLLPLHLQVPPFCLSRGRLRACSEDQIDFVLLLLPKETPSPSRTLVFGRSGQLIAAS